MEESQLLRTREKHGRKNPEQPRGVRYWTAVEVPGDMWFMVEAAASDGSDRASVKRFVTTDIAEALQLLHAHHVEWSHLHAYVRIPAVYTGSLFQRVQEVHRVDGSDETLVLRFLSGVMVTVRCGLVTQEQPVGLCHRIYPRVAAHS